MYVGDVAEAIARAAVRASTAGRIYELCGPYVYSLREIVELTAGTTGRRRWIVGLPTSLAKVQARMMDFVPGKPFSTDNFRSLSVHSLCDPQAPGLRALGINPTAVESVVGSYLGSRAA